MTGPSRPNIVLLVDDQHRWDALGSVWDDSPLPTWLREGVRPHTPHLDELAAGGTRFDNATCAVPVCVPSRHSFITGLRGHQGGVLSNQHYWPGEPPVATLAELAQQAGYATAAIGKLHWKPAAAPAGDVPTTRGFSYRVSYDGPRTDGPVDIDWADEATPRAIDYRAYCEERFGRGGENRLGYVGEVMPFDSDEVPDMWLAEHARRFLEEHARTSPQTPFLLVVSLDRPHPENVIPRDLTGLVDPAAVALPPVLDDEAEPDAYIDRIRKERGWDTMSEEELRLTIARYLTNVTLVDSCFGVVLNALHSLGLAGDTIVAMTSDHGEMLGERGLCFTKYSLYESAVRVPLILRWPGTVAAGTVRTDPVELIDLVPTFREAMGLGPDRSLPGHDLAAESAAASRLAFSEHYTVREPGAPRTQWTVRDGSHKLIERLGGGSSFFDLESDPFELRNLIDTPEAERDVARLRRRLLHLVMTEAEGYPARSGRGTRYIGD